MLSGDRQPIRLLVSLLAAFVLLGVVSSPARASSVAMGGGTLYVTADDGERNDLLVTSVSSGTYLVAERGTASPYISADAIFSTAPYLRASGAARSYTKAVGKYDRAAAGRILKRAKSLR